ncbi:outer membrane beta-barrel protein [Hymenobacter guriensis]|uniref:Outer membrane beta-barrel protein n=1 Tax=Hymenobacter guriensis TaxID=2793065 RepID=A0ABS0L025_9BACT|nr:outer membrane beta-barrel protein [Hymenobacter guriensis]MBG8553413.1 outer membrane beta-barrel protein [Hymenobacter guriensis]
MEPSADKPQNPQTGNLEQLFRQKFEEAEIAPRADLWAQIDHDLLVQQNETYRQRLQLHRWAAAACLLFAMAMGAWFTLHYSGGHEAGLAANTSAASRSASAAQPALNGEAPASLSTPARSNAARTTASVATATTGRSQTSPAAAGAAEASASRYTMPAGRRAVGTSVAHNESAPTSQERAYRWTGSSANPANPSATVAAVAASTATTTNPTATTEMGLPASGFAAQTSGSGIGSMAALRPAAAATQVGTDVSTADGLASGTLADAAASASLLTSGKSASFTDLAALTPRETALATAVSNLPSSLQPAYPSSALAWADELSREDEKKQTTATGWTFGGGHTLSSYNPNVNFSRGALPASNVRIASTALVNARMYEDGAEEYRENLQAGLGQRIMLLARRRLSSRWSVAAGVEAAEYRASSRTSYAALEPTAATTFTGGFSSTDRVRTQMATDLTVLNEPQKTRYRYRSAGVPVLVQYGNGAKNGWSLYARVGAAVNVLLGTRFSGEDENLVTQKSYSFGASDSPYRKVLTSVRGGAGMQYRPVGASWALAFGPAAETGLNTLNANPTQTYWQQSRPYSVGLEASVEFGAKAAPALAAH